MGRVGGEVGGGGVKNMEEACEDWSEPRKQQQIFFFGFSILVPGLRGLIIEIKMIFPRQFTVFGSFCAETDDVS